MNRFVRSALIVVAAFGVASQAPAQIKVLAPAGGTAAPAEPPKPEVIRLSVTPAAEPRPALRYSLLPRMEERKPGNAVPYYYRAILWHSENELRTANAERAKSQSVPSRSEQIVTWLSTPLASFPKDEARKILNGLHELEELRIAAYREECEWDWRLQDMEGTKGIAFLLEEIQQSRGLARVVALKARLEIAEGRYDDALETLRIGYQMARDVSRPPILINALVGYAIAGLCDEQLDALIDSPGSPNLYWALTELPRPFIDMRPAIEYEVHSPLRIFPFLKDAETAERSPEQWADLISGAIHTISAFGEWRIAPGDWQSRLAAAGLALKGYAPAKRELIAAGYDAAKVEKMPVGQVLAIHEARICRHAADETRKWTLVEYPAGRNRAREAEEELKREGYLAPGLQSRETIPIVSLLMPAINSANEAMIRRDASIAAHRVIEAIRMHAANGGKLPKSLTEITIVPVPIHPRTGEPFPYRLDGEKAILEVRLRTEAPQPMNNLDKVYEITIDAPEG